VGCSALSEVNVSSFNSVRIYTDLRREELENAILVTGFRGFGMIGYLVAKHLALSLNAEKRGFIVTEELMPPVVVIEEDGPAYPFELYYKVLENGKKLVVLVHRQNPEREVQDEYVRAIAEWARSNGISLMILVGGLNSDFMPEDEKHGYRWLANRYADVKLDAPTMEQGLAVVGPLALLYIYADINRIPAVMILPYTAADRADYEAAIKGLKLIGEEILGVKVNLEDVEKIAKMQREAMEMIESMLREKSGAEKEKEEGGMYM